MESGCYVGFGDDVTAATSDFSSSCTSVSEFKTHYFAHICFFPSLSYVLVNEYSSFALCPASLEIHLLFS